MPKTTKCPVCDGPKDERAKVCQKCRCQYSPARLGTGKDWHLHDGTGYMRKCIAGVKVYQHRDVMERHLGRKLSREEHVHHKDGNRLNNDISNLELTTHSEHARHHLTIRHAQRRQNASV